MNLYCSDFNVYGCCSSCHEDAEYGIFPLSDYEWPVNARLGEEEHVARVCCDVASAVDFNDPAVLAEATRRHRERELAGEESR